MLSAALRILATTALGGAAGFFGGVFGVGGGAIAIPLLGLLYHLDQQTAQGTTLVMVMPNVLLGFWRSRRRVGIYLRIAGALAFSAMASTYPAARFATALDPRGLRLAFATFLVILAAIIAYRTRRRFSRQPDRKPLPWGWSVPLGIGPPLSIGATGRCARGAEAGRSIWWSAGPSGGDRSRTSGKKPCDMRRVRERRSFQRNSPHPQ